MHTMFINEQLLRSFITLASVIEAKDAYTGGHTWRVSQYARVLGEKIGLENNDLFLVQLGGLVHDLGKIGIPDSILNKKDKLSDDEFNIMKKHTEIGKSLIENHPLADLVMEAIYKHHERVDGKGYPIGEQEIEMSIIPKIISIADAFDAMTSVRPYRKEMTSEMAFSILNKEKGAQFDKKLVDIFIDLGRNGKLNFILGHCLENVPMIYCPGCGPTIVPDKNKKDGDVITCPTCKGMLRLHIAENTFVLECAGGINQIYVPQINQDSIEDFMLESKKLIKIV